MRYVVERGVAIPNNPESEFGFPLNGSSSPVQNTIPYPSPDGDSQTSHIPSSSVSAHPVSMVVNSAGSPTGGTDAKSGSVIVVSSVTVSRPASYDALTILPISL